MLMKRIYGARINCELIRDFLLSMGDIRRAERSGDIDKMLVKRIMLAVTHVNGCALCSWFHTREALKIGMPQDEIKHLLDGEMADVPSGEAAALVFAQHYADTLGQVDSGAWRHIVKTYGTQKALGIRAAICMIMAGNAQGNIWGAFASRLKGKPQTGSSLGKELGVLACDIFAVPFMLVWAAFAAFIRLMVPESKEVYDFR
jgi:AhpD family alkylhydroperoxidase